MTKAEIKEWLKALGHDKVWLAEQLGVSVHAINVWLYASRPIPARSELKLGKLMQQHPANPAESALPSTNAPTPPENPLVLAASPSEIKNWNHAALLAGKGFSEWVLGVLNDATSPKKPSTILPRTILQGGLFPGLFSRPRSSGGHRE